MKRYLFSVFLLAAACTPVAAPPAETTVAPAVDTAVVAAPSSALSAAAADTLQRLKAAADVGDVADLIAIAAENPEFAFSFGDEPDFAAYLAAEYAAGRDPAASLSGILALPLVESDEDTRPLYVWPYFYALEAGEYSAETRADAARIVGAEAAAAISEDLGYLGPRAAIDAEGRWVFFLTGD